jgi:hypothetical protein
MVDLLVLVEFTWQRVVGELRREVHSWVGE